MAHHHVDMTLILIYIYDYIYIFIIFFPLIVYFWINLLHMIIYIFFFFVPFLVYFGLIYSVICLCAHLYWHSVNSIAVHFPNYKLMKY